MMIRQQKKQQEKQQKKQQKKQPIRQRIASVRKNDSTRSTCVRAALIGAMVTLTVAGHTAVANDAVIIGGGYQLTASQAQIELNVRYARETLETQGLNVTTYFTDGNAPGNDVFVQYQKPVDASYDALSRLLGNPVEQYREYRTHQLSNVAGGTERDQLLPALESHLRSDQPPQWLIYNGHGRQSQSTPDLVTLELWNNTQLTARELHDTLKTSTEPMRYVFTQCYSGGFHNIAYEESSNGLTPSEPMRCGFTAVSPYSLAEGCSASIDTEDYRDYTTHFFAALSGYDRNGEIVRQDPDDDNDGEVNPREAHFHTLLNADSTDLSWSTSEDFLARWEPWYLKWTPQPKALPNNEYAKLFRRLSQSQDVALHNGSVSDIRERLKALASERDEISTELKQTARSSEQLRRSIAEPIIAEWPSLMAPFTKGFEALNNPSTFAAINTLAEQDDRYPDLLAHHNARLELTTKALETERRITQLEKLLHLRKMATLKDQLTTYGSDQDIASYEHFVACEEMPVNSANLQHAEAQ